MIRSTLRVWYSFLLQPAICMVVGWKSLYLGGLLLVIWNTQEYDTEMFHSARLHWPREGEPVFASHLATWDAAYYLRISEIGYGKGMSSCAFYPLWPYLIRWTSPLVDGSHLLSGLLLANLLSLGAWVIFYDLVREGWGSITARWSLVFLIAFPGGLFFQFIYSESLFLLVMCLWYGLQRRNYGVAALSAGLLPITRAIGVFSLLPIAWHVMSVEPPAWLGKTRDRCKWFKYVTPNIIVSSPSTVMDSDNGFQHARFGKVRRSVLARLLLVVPLLGWSGYLACMWHWTGNPFEGFQAQMNWNVHSINNIWNIPKFIVELLTPTQWHDFKGSLLDRCVFVLLAYCLPSIWKMDKGLFVWAWVLGVIPAMSGTFTSYTRFASCAFPLFIALAVFCGRPERRWFKWVLLSVFIVLHAVLLWRFVNFRWAG
jgi:hypothetical protein